MPRSSDHLFLDARLATLAVGRPGLGVIERGAVAAKDGRIVYCGEAAELPARFRTESAEIVRCDGRWITPGLIDCHTHLVFAGDRAAEWELRQSGATYEEIALRGGGILSTVAATRAASEDALVRAALPRLDRLIAEGVTTVEIKSGYGLDPDNEAKMLRAAGHLAREREITVVRTFLGAHALPPEAAGDRDRYVAEVCDAQLPLIAKEGLADAVDGFCERIAFSADEIARVFDAARRHGLPVKLHAEQLSDRGGAALAARHGALSADHLEYLGADGIAAMADAGTVAVLLPGAFYFLKETRKPPVEALRRAGVPIAIATDCNPGSSPLSSLLLAMNMGATLFGLSVEECLTAVTRNAALALGRAAEAGSLEVAKWCDLAVWEVERPAELVYRMGFNPLHMRVWRGHCSQSS